MEKEKKEVKTSEQSLRDKVEKLAIETYTKHRNSFETLKDRWLEYEEKYYGKLKQGSVSEQTKTAISLNDAYSLVENAIPRLVGQQPKYRLLGREKADERIVETYNEFSDYQWEEAMVQQELKELVKIGCIYGLAGWKMGWKNEVLRKRNSTTVKIYGYELSLPKIFDKDEVIKNYTFEAIRPFDLIWSLDSDNPSKCRVFGHQSTKRLEEFEVLGFNMDKLKESMKGESVDWWSERGYDLEKITLDDACSDMSASLAELYVRVINNKKYEYFVVYVANTDQLNPVVIDVKENPFDKKFTPMGVWRPTKKPSKMHGTGVIEPVYDLLSSKDDLFNISMENLLLDVARPMEYNVSNVVDEETVEYKPGGLIPVRRLGETVSVLPTPRLPSIVSLFFDLIQRQQQNVSGITDFQTGADNIKGDKTLGEIQIKTSESNSRLKMMLDSLEKEVLEPMGRMALWLNKQYLADDDSIVYRIVGNKGKMKESKIKFKEIEAIKDISVVPGSSSLLIQQSELAKWSQFLNQVYMEAKQPNPVNVNKEEAWRRMIEFGMGVKEVEAFIPSLREQQQEKVNSKMSQINDAKSENIDPSTARVLPTDEPDVHIPLHKAAVQNQGSTDNGGNFIQLSPEQVQLLMSHLNQHIQAQGGMVQPEMMAQPQEPNQPNQA